MQVSLTSACPVLTIQVAIADGFGQVGGLDVLAAFEVGDGARYFQDAVVGAGREVETVHGVLQQSQAAVVGTGVERKQAAVHLGIAIDAGDGGVALFLNLTGAYHPFANDGAGLAGAGVGHLFEGYGDDFDLQVDTVEQWAGDAVQVFLHLTGRAYAGFGGVVVVAAGTGVHAGHEHEAGRIVDVALHARDADFAVFERLAQHFEHVAVELGQFAI